MILYNIYLNGFNEFIETLGTHKEVRKNFSLYVALKGITER